MNVETLLDDSGTLKLEALKKMKGVMVGHPKLLFLFFVFKKLKKSLSRSLIRASLSLIVVR